MRISRPVSGKILACHGVFRAASRASEGDGLGEGMGVPTAGMVRRRAAELAWINGRGEPGETDWKQAFRELHGGHHGAFLGGGHGGGGLVEAWLRGEGPEPAEELFEPLGAPGALLRSDGVAPGQGRHPVSGFWEDGESLGEELVGEGLEEAAHDQMLQAHWLEERHDG